ncbi:hypothetical protein EQV77_16750 [Halobacillus fulvus]|nr:hypothetical protein EQV77_16750 [Halobacillus fulvus]
MKGKVQFTRDAFRPNVSLKERPPYVEEKYVMCEIGVLLEQFSQLRLKSGWTIISRDGRVFAQSQKGQQCPFMEAVIGDESPFSYVQAAILYHYLLEYSQSDHQTVDPDTILDDPWIQKLDLFGYWTFGKVERSLNPMFFYDSLLHPVVIFFTHHTEGVEHVVKHIQRFDHLGYGMRYHQRTWATSNRENPFMRDHRSG